jgi:hypothetical protein
MSKPKTIKLRGSGKYPAEFFVIGYKNKDSKPYLALEVPDSFGHAAYYGYVKDRDIKRLKKWCEDCLKERK